jgi:hypothetical protein
MCCAPAAMVSFPNLFTGASPEMLYFEGTRHFYLSGSGFNMLRDTTGIRSSISPGGNSSDEGTFLSIPSENIIFTTDKDNNTSLMWL